MLLGRIAHYFPDFDYYEQGVIYEDEYTSSGFVTYWANTTRDLFDLAIAFDMVRDSLSADTFIGDVFEMSAETFTNTIEAGIFETALAHQQRYESNPPHTDLAVFVTNAVLPTSRVPQPRRCRRAGTREPGRRQVQALSPSMEPHGSIMRNFRNDDSPSAGWSVRVDLRDEEDAATDVGVVYRSVTDEARVTLCESWVDLTRSAGSATSNEWLIWIPIESITALLR